MNTGRHEILIGILILVSCEVVVVEGTDRLNGFCFVVIYSVACRHLLLTILIAHRSLSLLCINFHRYFYSRVWAYFQGLSLLSKDSLSSHQSLI
jgi:hypothetical protein